MRKYVHVVYCSVQLLKLPEGRGIEWRMETFDVYPVHIIVG